MNIHEIMGFLLRSAVINYALLLVWFGVFVFCHDWMYRVHTRWFQLSVEVFDTINYAGMAIYKLGIVLFVLVPLLAIYLSY